MKAAVADAAEEEEHTWTSFDSDPTCMARRDRGRRNLREEEAVGEELLMRRGDTKANRGDRKALKGVDGSKRRWWWRIEGGNRRTTNWDGSSRTGER